ncbi:phosphotransferase enzyme family protein [Ktedonobacter robiniae]|uniref:Aminoglycoside phosphotransferase domain-containing protein n=1 Tax=Ktedonobacter robiniae TaxID=2778365 RepID=A0ABQ3UZ68_9CHLR|nr:phosphotransferase [Ktedonobacter robiniae]GHO57968.1 hypothetical protein KSB_64430 [Ktedonobacter robiniae]
MSHILDTLADKPAFSVPFPVTHSILAPEALLAEVLPLYDLDEQVSCLFLTRGVNDTYLVQSGTTKYILRVYRAGWRSLSDVLYEIDVVRYLDQKGIAVSMPVSQRDGGFVSTLQAPEGPRQAVLFTYAPGVELDRHDARDSYLHGRVIGAMHNAASGFTSVRQRTPLDLSLLADQSLQTIQPLYTGSATDWAYLEELVERLRARIRQLAGQGLDWGACHGDSHMLNEHMDEDGTITLFDFDCCAPGWRAYDLAVVRWCEGFYNWDPGDTLWQSFLKGYTEVRPLAEVDLASIPAFVALREVWHTALVASLQPSSGARGFERMMQRTMRLLREWEVKL